jgi:adenosylcobinamide kinase/adenosylcobinamide-phosphate guanylyltransferase
VLGGTRSGKSRHAEDLLPADGRVRYVATARRRADDQEWSARIDVHRARRPPSWTTLEDVDVAAVVRAGGGPLLVDDLATWLTGVLDDTAAWEAPSVPAAVGAADLPALRERAGSPRPPAGGGRPPPGTEIHG